MATIAVNGTGRGDDTLTREERPALGVEPVRRPAFDRPVNYVAFRYRHHSPHSGYARLAEYGGRHFAGETITVAKPLSRRIIRERMLWRLAKGTPGYDRAAMAAEWQVARRALRAREEVFHFLYGEKTYHYAGRLNGVRGNRVLATFHLPPDGLRHAVQIDWHLRQLAGVVCVGRNQQNYFAELLGPDRVFFAPLGVDTAYFTPPADDARDPDLCVFVGENYRDYPTLRGVIELVAYRRPGTRFVGVTTPAAAQQLGKHPNLTILSGIAEEELRRLYRTAALHVMPLHDCTANNAVLEGMACGLPMIASDVGAIRDYTSQQATVYVPRDDARAMADVVLDLLDAPEARTTLGQASRAHALKFAWPHVVAGLESIYSNVI